MRPYSVWSRRLPLLVPACLLALITCSCSSLELGSSPLDGDGPLADGDGVPSVQKVAHEIDCLERHIERYGSIVPQHASVWGQSRLMMHRNEFERVMRADIYGFQQSIQGTISASDQAYLANALSLQAGAGTLPAVDPMTLVSSPNDVITRNQLTKMAAISNYVTPNGKLALEPTLIEDQKKRYLDHLHQLRRINEGDDNTDAPGYSLNLVRLPVSVLTGHCTQTGYGAECTFTAALHLPDDLLPVTFKELVANDITDLLTLPLTRFIDTIDEQTLKGLLATYEKQITADPMSRMNQTAAKPITTELSAKLSSSIPSSSRRINQAPLPPSQLILAYGPPALGYLIQEARLRIKDHLGCKGTAYHLDVQSWLRNELGAAYEFLSLPETQHLWHYCGPVLAHALRNQDRKTVFDLTVAFFDEIERMRPLPTPTGQATKRSATSVLAWGIIVDASLLNEKFLEDMRITQAAKGCPCPPPEGYPLFLPHPPTEVCQAFNQYVQCRWPLHIFALDPETEDQNIGDSFSLRREMQLAMSVAFTSGQIGARTFNQYVRRIEKDIDTISLNRTIVGFSHGDNTFGWRFYPRVQTPPIDGNLEVIFRDLLIGGYGPRYDLRRRRLENGIRECVALVIMPSFVPYMDLDVTANFFALANPKCKAMNLKQTMRLSRTVKAIQDQGLTTRDDHCYRPGDVGLMFSKLDQLSQRLPLQHQLVNVPYENTHSGFELLSTGVTDLAPELNGWYGAPGINPADDTALFLVGDNFSVHQTRVIVGGRWLDPSCTIDCNTAGGASVDCKCPTPAATAAAPTPSAASAAAPAPAPATMPMSSGRATPGRPVAVEADKAGDVQQANFLQNSRAASNARPPQPPAVIQVLPTVESALQTAVKSVAQDINVFRAALHTSNTTKTNTTTVTQSGGNTNSSSPSTGATSPGTGGSSPSSSSSPGGGSKSTSTAASPSSGDGQSPAVVQQTTSVATNTTTVNPNSQVQIPHFQVELLSRQVMRVVIPKGVYTNNGFVDVHIATPYGVSPHLSIPVLCSEAKKPATALLTLDSTSAAVTVRCCWKACGPIPCDGKLEPVNWSPGVLPLKWAAAKDLTPKTVVVQLAFQSPNGKLPTKNLTLTGKSGTFNLPVSELTASVLDGLAGVGQYKSGDALPAIQGTITVLQADTNPIYDTIGAVSQKVQITFEMVSPPQGHLLMPAPVP